MNNEFHQEYLDEARQILQALEQSLLQFEKTGEAEELNNLYRCLHTLKGSAGMFGFFLVEKLSHELESVFQDIRDGIRQFDNFIFDLTLHSVDVLRDLIDGKDVGKETESIIVSLTGGGHKSAEGATTVSGKTAGTQECFLVLLTPEREVFKRGINVRSVIEEAQSLGASELIVHNESVPLEKQFINKDLVSWFELFIATEQGVEAVSDIFFFLKSSEYKIIPVKGPEIFNHPDYSKQISLNETQKQERSAMLQSIFPGWLAETESKEIAVATAAEDIDNNDGVIRKARKGGHVNVASEKLDHLINIVSELVIFRTEIQHLMAENENPAVVQALEKLERLTLGLRDSAFNIRLVPLSVLNVKLQRLVRSVSNELGKEVEFITEGLDTELDRAMIGALEAPLMHLIRNAMDHGIEKPEGRAQRNKPAKGLVKLYSYNSGDHVFIQLQDDGNGIDFDKIREKGIAKGLLNKNSEYSEKELINIMMQPGFSTAEKLTTVSGRGVGMDVVKKEINALRGDIEVSTEKGLGSIFTLRLPLTLTVLDTLVVKVQDDKFLIPLNEVEHCFTEQHDTLFFKKSRNVNYGGQLLPFVSLREQFKLDDHPAQETVIVVNKNDRRIAVVVDKIVGTLQTVYKPLNDLMHEADCFSGASVLGDGTMALIINPLKLKN